MNKFFIHFVLITTSVFAQWTKVASYNVGTTGKMAMRHATVCLYGNNAGLLR